MLWHMCTYSLASEIQQSPSLRFLLETGGGAGQVEVSETYCIRQPTLHISCTSYASSIWRRRRRRWTKLPIIAPYIYYARYHALHPYILSTTVLSDCSGRCLLLLVLSFTSMHIQSSLFTNTWLRTTFTSVFFSLVWLRDHAFSPCIDRWPVCYMLYIQ